MLYQVAEDQQREINDLMAQQQAEVEELQERLADCLVPFLLLLLLLSVVVSVMLFFAFCFGASPFFSLPFCGFRYAFSHFVMGCLVCYFSAMLSCHLLCDLLGFLLLPTVISVRVCEQIPSTHAVYDATRRRTLRCYGNARRYYTHY